MTDSMPSPAMDLTIELDSEGDYDDEDDVITPIAERADGAPPPRIGPPRSAKTYVFRVPPTSNIACLPERAVDVLIAQLDLYAYSSMATWEKIAGLMKISQDVVLGLARKGSATRGLLGLLAHHRINELIAVIAECGRVDTLCSLKPILQSTDWSKAKPSAAVLAQLPDIVSGIHLAPVQHEYARGPESSKVQSDDLFVLLLHWEKDAECRESKEARKTFKWLLKNLNSARGESGTQLVDVVELINEGEGDVSRLITAAFSRARYIVLCVSKEYTALLSRSSQSTQLESLLRSSYDLTSGEYHSRGGTRLKVVLMGPSVSRHDVPLGWATNLLFHHFPSEYHRLVGRLFDSPGNTSNAADSGQALLTMNSVSINTSDA